MNDKDIKKLNEIRRKVYMGQIDMIEAFKRLKKLVPESAQGLGGIQGQHFSAVFEVEQNTMGEIYAAFEVEEPEDE